MAVMGVADGAIRELLRREVLQPAIIERALDRALTEVVEAQRTAAGGREALRRRLFAFEQELSNLSDAAARSGAVPAILEALARRDEECCQVAARLATFDASHESQLDPWENSELA